MNRMIYRGGQASGMGMVPGGQLGKAKYALASGRADEAERLLRKRLERQPDDTAARLLLAQTLLQQRQVAEATTEVRRVLREQPTNAEAHLLLSATLVQKGGLRVPAEAEKAARRAIQLQPKSASAHAQLAEVLAAQRDTKRARIAIEDALRLDPRAPATHLMRGLILLSDKDPEGAILAAEAAIRHGRSTLAPASLAQAEFIKANALIETKRYDEALTSLDTAERQNPLLGGVNMRSQRGRIYFRQRKYRLSYQEYLAAVRTSGRLKPIAPVIAALNMVLSIFGDRAQYALMFIIGIVLLLVIGGVSLIPAVGGWLAMLIVVGVLGYTIFAGLQAFQGGILPKESAARLMTIGTIVGVTIAGTVLVLLIERGIVNGLMGQRNATQFDPWSFGIALTVGLALSALATFVLARATRRGAAA